MNDAIGDLLIRIKNASMANRGEVISPYSQFREKLLKILQEEKIIDSFKIEGEGVNKRLLVKLIVIGNKCHIVDVKKISKPGQRVYIKVSDLPKVNRRIGINIISTPKGLMTTKKASQENQGGELICRVIF